MIRRMATLAGATLAVCTALAPATAVAQLSDQWQFGAQLYGYFPSLDGKTNFPASGGSPSVEVDVDNHRKRPAEHVRAWRGLAGGEVGAGNASHRDSGAQDHARP